jgi:predicted short-subunit dehydrogenase-like oxidoreductase (DUF2520 family)
VPASEILSRSVGLVGPGRAGRAFARSWLSAGGRLLWVLARDPSSAADVGAEQVVAPGESPLADCDVVVLAVPDDAISEVARDLASRVSCRHAFHVSGALGSEAIAPLRAVGAATASLHPVRPFTGDSSEDWTGAFVAVEGDERGAAEGERIAAAVGARPYRLSETDRALYHASATLAAGGTAALVSIAARGWAAAGIPEDVARETLGALASRAAAAAASRPFAEAFTGAVARRDVGTIRRHVAALANHPETLALYRSLAEEALRRTAPAGRADEVRRILRGEEPPR